MYRATCGNMAHAPTILFGNLCSMSSSTQVLSTEILPRSSCKQRFDLGRRSSQKNAARIVAESFRKGSVIRSRVLGWRLQSGGFRAVGGHHNGETYRHAFSLKAGSKRGALASRNGDLIGESLSADAGAGRLARRTGKRGADMATMTVPRALMEDTSSESPPLLDAEAPSAKYATLGDASAASKAAGDEAFIDSLEPSPAFSQWDSTTARLADSATAAFLLLQLPQIILNTQNLMAGNYAALSAVPWMGQLTGLLGNLSLLSYFASKKERGAMVVQAVGVVSTLVVLSQLAIAGAMPSTAFAVTASVVVVGLVLNFLNYKNKLSPELWRLWGEAVSVGGVTVLPQVMWATFEPYIPHSILPGTLFGTVALTVIALARFEKLPPKFKSVVGSVSAWTATLLFMWAPVAQWWQNYLYPANIKGLSVFTILLAMVGNALLLPRALFTRDLMWFTGSSWGTLLQGWGILISMYTVQAITDITFWGVTGVLFLWLGAMLWNDSKAFDLGSPFSPLIELISGKRF